MAKAQKQNFIGGAAVLAAAVAVTKVLGAVYKIPLGNLLDKEGMAHFYVAYNIYSLLLILSTAGLPLALSRLVSQAHALGRENQKRRVFRVALAIFFAIGLVCSGAMLLFPQQLAAALHDSLAAPSIQALAPSVLCVCLISAIRGYTQGQGNMKPTAVSQIIESACKLVVGLALAWTLLRAGRPSHEAAAGAIAGVTVGSALSLAVLCLYMLRRSAQRGTDVPQSRRDIAAELLRIGVPVTVGAGGMSFITLLDQMLVMSTLQDKLGLSEGAATALYGEYTFGMTLFNLPSSFIYPITISLIPAIGAALARGDRESACSQTETAFRVTALLALPAGTGLAVLSGPILGLLYPAVPETAAAAAYHLSVLGIACIFVCLMVMTAGVLQAYGHEYIPVLSLLCGGALKVVANYLLVADPEVGIRGAAVGTLCCYVLIVLINLIAIHRLVPRRPDYFAVFCKPVLATAAMALVARGSWSLLDRLSGGSRAAVLAAIVLAVAVYVMAALLLGAIRRQDLAALPKGEKLADFLHIQR
ncbi:MAG: polysaccharide biosynthesis protein [Ruminococcaceae bacterium]|nr:polysaccharide biosynthesis protein [Oscillospiraceae bacterium]